MRLQNARNQRTPCHWNGSWYGHCRGSTFPLPLTGGADFGMRPEALPAVIGHGDGDGALHHTRVAYVDLDVSGVVLSIRKAAGRDDTEAPTASKYWALSATSHSGQHSLTPLRLFPRWRPSSSPSFVNGTRCARLEQAEVGAAPPR
jgi:hypothetical protein